MLTPYSRMVAELGEDGAKAEMRRRRGLVKNPGLANSTDETRKRVSRASAEARIEKAKSETES